MERNCNPGATNLLTSMRSGLQSVVPTIDYEKVAKLSEAMKGTEVLETAKISEAIATLNQQQRLIGGLQSSYANAMKVAAALTEAVKLAQDAVIDVSDVFDHARRSLAGGHVKLSSADEMFEQSPGELMVQGSETKVAEGTDVLTQTLRDIRTVSV